MAIQFPISLNAINTEVASVDSGSLVTLSQNAIEGLSTLNEAPYAMSEFNNYTHILTSGNLTNGYIAGTQYAPAYSGYSAVGVGGYGSWSGSTFEYDGDTVHISLLTNLNPVGSDSSIYLTFARTNNSNGTFNNSGWTSLNIYLNQTNNSGNPELTLARAAASSVLTGSNIPTIHWTWGPSSSYAISSYFGTTSGNVHHIEIL